MANLRTDIGQALVDICNTITVANGYSADIKESALRLRFLDEVEVFPAVYITAGNENRQYLPQGQNRMISFLLRLYVNEDNAYLALNALIDDIDTAIATKFKADRLTNLVTNITIEAITTDEGILDPEGVAEFEILATVNQLI